MAHVAAERPDVGNLLPMVLLDELGAERVVLSLPSPFLVTKLDAPGVREVVLRGLAAAFGGTPSLEMVEGDRPDGVSLSRLDQAARRAAVDAARKKVMEHPLVVEAVRALGAEVRDVKLPA